MSRQPSVTLIDQFQRKKEFRSSQQHTAAASLRCAIARPAKTTIVGKKIGNFVPLNVSTKAALGREDDRT